MSQFNSIFSPLTNKLARLAGITLLAVAALFASTQQMSAQVACVQNLTVSLDRNCEMAITKQMVVTNSAALPAGAYIKINDNNPNDDDFNTGDGKVNTVSPASGWTYGVFLANGQILCQGTIVVTDNIAPVFNARAEAHWATIDTIITWADNLDEIYNNTASWTGNTNNTWGGALPVGHSTRKAAARFYTGQPWMADACEQIQSLRAGSPDNIKTLAGTPWLGHVVGTDNVPTAAADSALANTWPDLVGGAVQYRVTDYLESQQCDSSKVNGRAFHYKLRRSFQIIDKRGNDTTLNQIIYFQRPDPRGTSTNPLARTYDRNSLQEIDKGPGNLGQFGPFGQNKRRARLAYGSANNFTPANQVTATSTFSLYGVDSMALRSGVPNYSQFIDTIGFDISSSACNGAPTDAAGIRVVLRNLYVAIDTTVGGVQDSLSLFDPEFAARNNYSVDFTYTGADFPVCNRGRKYQVITSVFDWCEGGIEKDTVILKFEDRTAPQFSVKNTAANGGAILGQYSSNPATISVNTNDCSGSLRLPEKSESSTTRATGFERDLGTLFNWTVSDACAGTAVRLNYRFQTSKEYNNGYFIDRTDFVDRNYTVANMNGGPVALGLPVGFHRIIIEAWDGCSVENTDTLWFNVNDQVAPIMKCDDQLNITLTSNSTSNYYVSNKDKELDQYARLYVSDINEGSRDNCTLDSMFVRRKVSAATIGNYLSWNRDYDTYSASGSSNGTVGTEDFEQIGNTTMYYTPKHMQYVEFYCTDGGAYNSQLSESPMVELWGSDVNQPIFFATGNNIFTSNPLMEVQLVITVIGHIAGRLLILRTKLLQLLMHLY